MLPELSNNDIGEKLLIDDVNKTNGKKSKVRHNDGEEKKDEHKDTKADKHRKSKKQSKNKESKKKSSKKGKSVFEIYN